MNSKVELIYDADCPNVEAARAQLRRALQAAGGPVEWQEWDQGDPASPTHVRQYGSPTVLVEGRDVAGVSPSEGADCCRVYQSDENGLQGVPSVEAIASALRNGNVQDTANGGWRSWLSVIPAAGVALLPNLACPACWPAYAGLLTSIGMGFLIQTTFLLPITTAFLLLAVGTLGFHARNRHGYGPFLMGLVAGIVIIAGKFAFESDLAMYAGIALLIGASVWNSWPKRTKASSGLECVELKGR